MERRTHIFVILLFALAVVGGCSQESTVVRPATTAPDKDGTETLGPPSIAIAAGSGFVQGGVGMVGVASAELTVEVPAGAQVVQALLYWAGGTTAAEGDDEISLDGNLIQGQVIGGPTVFFGDYSFLAYRADITGLNLVGSGMNAFTVADFDFTGSTVDENDGVSLLVIYDDGNEAEIILRDGLDMAYFGFEPTLNATLPQDFVVAPQGTDRVADLVIIAGSVGENRPNRVRVTTSAGEQIFDDALGSNNGPLWDSVVLPVEIAAGVDEVSVELVSTDSQEPLGASLGWVVAGLALPQEVEYFEIAGAVFEDADRDGVFAEYEWGVANVVIELHDAQGLVATAVTSPQIGYAFQAPAGEYTVQVNLADYPEAFNADLAAFFDATATLSLPVTVGPSAAGLDFGFVPRTEQILADLDAGELLSDALPVSYWKMLFRRALIEEQSNRQGNGHGRGHGRGNGNGNRWGHSESFNSGEELIAILNEIATLYLVEPYQFTPGSELQEAFDILSSRPRDDEGLLRRELLVTELNYVSGLGLLEQSDVLGTLISWGESLLNFDDESAKSGGVGPDKNRRDDLSTAVRIFGGINTGGGGGVDE